MRCCRSGRPFRGGAAPPGRRTSRRSRRRSPTRRPETSRCTAASRSRAARRSTGSSGSGSPTSATRTSASTTRTAASSEAGEGAARASTGCGSLSPWPSHGDALYVADTWNGRVQAFGLDGKPRGTAGDLYGPRGVTVAPDGRVWVTDTGNHRVVSFAPDLTDPKFFGKKGSGPDEFSSPVGIAASPSGDIYVADTSNKRIRVLSASGGAAAAPGPRLGRERRAAARGRAGRHDLRRRTRGPGAVLVLDPSGALQERDHRRRGRTKVREPDRHRDRPERPYPLRRQLGHQLDRPAAARSEDDAEDAVMKDAAAATEVSVHPQRGPRGRAILLLSLLALAALITRFWALGDRPAPPRRVDPRLPVVDPLAGRRLAVRPGVPRAVPLLRQRARLQALRRDRRDRAAHAGGLRRHPHRVSRWPLRRWIGTRAAGGVRRASCSPRRTSSTSRASSARTSTRSSSRSRRSSPSRGSSRRTARRG